MEPASRWMRILAGSVTSLICDHCAISDHSATIIECLRRSNQQKVGHFSAKSGEEEVDRCKPNFKATWERHGGCCMQKKSCRYIFWRLSTMQEHDRQTTEWWHQRCLIISMVVIVLTNYCNTEVVHWTIFWRSSAVRYGRNYHDLRENNTSGMVTSLTDASEADGSLVRSLADSSWAAAATPLASAALASSLTVKFCLAVTLFIFTAGDVMLRLPGPEADAAALAGWLGDRAASSRIFFIIWTIHDHSLNCHHPHVTSCPL